MLACLPRQNNLVQNYYTERLCNTNEVIWRPAFLRFFVFFSLLVNNAITDRSHLIGPNNDEAKESCRTLDYRIYV